MSKVHHLTAAFLRAVLDGKMTTEAAVYAVCHTLASHCEQCAFALRDALAAGTHPPDVEESAGAPWNLDAEVYLSLLRAVPPGDRARFVVHALTVPDALLRPLLHLIFQEVRRNITSEADYAAAGVWLDTASALVPDDGPPALIALGHAHRGNLERVQGHFSAAEPPLRTALTVIGPFSTVEPDVAAQVYNLAGSLYLDMRDLRRARELFAAALEHGEAADYPEETAKAAIKLALAERYAGHPEDAVRLGYHALRSCEPDSRLAQIASFNLVHHLLDSGDPFEARLLLMDISPGLPDAWQPQALWLEGRLTAAEGRWSEAEVLLLESRALFARSALLDAALVDLDLAALYLGQGRWGEIPPLIDGALRGFEDVPAYIVSAYRHLAEAVRRRTLTAAQLVGVSESLRDWRDRPRHALAH